MKYTIEEILQMQEGQTFDRKSILIEPSHLATIIVAMANADGGMIAVGISDKTRRIEGVDQDKKHLNDILRTPLDFCAPSVPVTTDYVPCIDAEGRENRVLLMFVPASPRLHANQADEVFWRVGDKSKKLTFDDRLQLMYDKGERYYEDSTAYDATLEDIDMDAVKAYMKRIGYGKSAMEYLQENKGFVTYKGDIPQVSAACILLFGKYPQTFFPRARVRFIKYFGTEEKVGREMNVIKDVLFEGRILEQIQKAVEYLETQVKEHSYLGEDGIFKTDREYPKFVIQEMVVNSVCHRDYSIKGTEIQIKMFDDRLVFETPGKLPGIVRTDNIRHTHFSRNPKIAEFLKAYDYVKEFGEGVDRMCRELSALGVREPQYNLVAFIMKATVCANVLDEGQETTQKNYPETTQIQEIDQQGKKRARKGQEKGKKKFLKLLDKIHILVYPPLQSNVKCL
ncbi:MAG: RNA-binding domain-containing protein [Odoribacter splanchnicus]